MAVNFGGHWDSPLWQPQVEAGRAPAQEVARLQSWEPPDGGILLGTARPLLGQASVVPEAVTECAVAGPGQGHVVPFPLSI